MIRNNLKKIWGWGTILILFIFSPYTFADKEADNRDLVLWYLYDKNCKFCDDFTSTLELLSSKFRVFKLDVSGGGVMEAFEVDKIPAIVVMDRMGNILKRFQGLYPAEMLIKEINILSVSSLNCLLTRSPDDLITPQNIDGYGEGKMLWWIFHYKDGNLIPKNLKLKAGYPPNYKVGGTDGYFCQVKDKSGRVIFRFGVTIAQYESYTFREKNRYSHRMVERNNFETIIFIPFFFNAEVVELLDYSGRAIASASIQNAEMDEYQEISKSPTGYTTLVYNRRPEDGLDIVFLGDKYFSDEEQELYRKDVDAHLDVLLKRYPLTIYFPVLNIYRVDGPMDLGCRYLGGGYFLCDDRKVFEAASILPYDEIMVIMNTDIWGGTSGVTYGGGGRESYCQSSRVDPIVSTHEFGHSFGGLQDEYYVGGIGRPFGPNCDYAGCAKWSGYPGTGCFQGCYYDNLYRPTLDDCVMMARDVNNPRYDFCPVCQRYLKYLLGKYLTVPPLPPVNVHVESILAQSLFGAIKYNRITWDPVLEWTRKGYNVYQVIRPGIEYKLLTPSPITMEKFVHKDLKPEEEYKYVVTAISPTGIESNFSEMVSDMQSASKSSKPMDINGSGELDEEDLEFLSSMLGRSVKANPLLAPGDLNGNGIIDGRDLILLAEFLQP